MTIGELLKKYRLSQDKTQADWAAGIVTTSYYSKIEKNQHRINAEDLIDILHKNEVSTLDFFSELNYKDKLKKDNDSDIERLITDYYYQGDVKSLERLKKMLADSNIDNKSDKILRINGFIAIMNHSVNSLKEKDLNELKEKIFNLPGMDRMKLVLYCNYMYFYDIDSNLLITKSIINNVGSSKDVKIQEALLAIIYNLVGTCIEKKNLMKFNFL